jgi:hypothetical protein
MEDSRYAKSSLSSPYKQRMFRSISISNNYRNFKNIQYFGGSSNSLDHNNKRNTYPDNGGGGGGGSNSGHKEVHKQANNNVNSDDNLISYEHLSESSSWIELVLPFTIFTITIIAVIFIAFILFAWIRKTLREDNYRRCVTKKVSNDDDDKEKILEERLKNSSSSSSSGTKRCEKTKNSSKSQNKMNSRKWLREKTKQIDNSVVSDDVEQKLETIEYKSTPPTSPNSQKDSKVKEEEVPKTEILHEIVKTNPFSCPMTISDISVTSVIQPQQSW